MRPLAAHVHLDPLGGAAGDMFIAAVLDAWPSLEPVLAEAVAACGLPDGWRVAHTRRLSASIEARHFQVLGPAQGAGASERVGHGSAGGHAHGHAHAHRHGDGRHANHGRAEPRSAAAHANDGDDANDAHHHHDSGRYADIVTRIERMALAAPVRARAQDIYHRLAECEAVVHGIAIDDVHFHELADWDSTVDIVGAAALIEALGGPTWSVASLPLGSGTVRTAHGPLPVPAPATARLLRGFVVHDDGIAGERVTPTGAAILASLQPSAGRGALRGRLGVTGLGAGTRQLPGCANVLRLQAFDAVETPAHDPVLRDEVGVVEMDIDDQSAEELATGLDALRAEVGVIDVLSRPAFGKKGRHVVEVRVLCEPARLEATARACLAQTASLGVRVAHSERRLLPRRLTRVDTEAGTVNVKLAVRPDGHMTAKAEHADVAAIAGDQRARRRLARDAEARALADRDAASDRLHGTGEPDG